MNLPDTEVMYESHAHINKISVLSSLLEHYSKEIRPLKDQVDKKILRHNGFKVGVTLGLICIFIGLFMSLLVSLA